jgi:hypothetical protein
MTDSNDNELRRRVLDIAAGISISYAVLILPVWCIYDPAFHSHTAPGTIWPIQLRLLFLDVIPCPIGVAWLMSRHGEALAAKWPFMRTLAFRLIMMASGLLYGTVLSVLLSRK